ncbi:sensor histidine kinase [Thalassotalea piscium]
MTFKDVYYDNTAQRKKRIIQVFWLCEIGFLLVSFHPLLSLHWSNITLIAILAALLCFVYIEAQKNHLDRATNILLAIISTALLLFAWLNQGVRDEALLIFPALITFAVLISSKRTLYIMLAVIIGNILLMGYLNDLGLFMHPLDGTGLKSAIVVSIMFGLIVYSIRILGLDLIQANQELKHQQDILENEVKERTQTLEYTLAEFIKTKNDLAEADKMASLGRLVAGIAHEVNTPIGVAVTAASLLKDKNDKILAAFESNTLARNQLSNYLTSSEQSMNLLNANLQRASNLISDFKEVAVLKEDERKKVFKLSDEISNVFAHLQLETEKACFHIHIECPKEIKVYQDPEVLTRVLINLYRNSIKHGFEGREEGHIHVRVAKANDAITLSYQDDGIGMSENTINRVFEPFYTTKRGQGGTGLGMHIVFNLVTQSLNGTIHYDHHYNNGTKFDITFCQNLENSP